MSWYCCSSTIWIFLVRYGYNAPFVIVHVRCCPAAMVLVAVTTPESGLEVSIQSPETELKINWLLLTSVSVKGPEPNVMSWLPPSVREKEYGWVLVSKTCTLKEPWHDAPPGDSTQTLFTINVPVVGAAALHSSWYKIIYIICWSLVTRIWHATITTCCITICILFGILLQDSRVGKYCRYICCGYPSY